MKCKAILNLNLPTVRTAKPVVRVMEDDVDGTQVVRAVAFKEKQPYVMWAFQGEDFKTYIYEEKKWTTSAIVGNWYSYHYYDLMQELRKFKCQDTDKLKRLLHSNKTEWMNIIADRASEISNNRSKNREVSKEDRKKKLLKLAPDPSVEFVMWAKKQNNEHYGYYKRQGTTAFVTCSHCGMREKYWTGNVETFEDMARKHIDPPRDKEESKCRFCGAPIIYRPEGRMRDTMVKKVQVIDVQNIHGDIVVSNYDMVRTYHLAAAEEEELVPVSKVFYREGRKTATEIYFDGDQWLTKTENTIRHDNGWYGYSYKELTVNRDAHAVLYPMVTEVIKGTFLEHSGFYEYKKACKGEDLIQYLEAYMKTPELEYLVKLGFFKMAKACVEGRKIEFGQGKRLADRLGIHPKRVKELQRQQGDLDWWKVYQLEKELGVSFSESEEWFFKRNINGVATLKSIFQRTGHIHRTVNYIIKMDLMTSEIGRYSDYLRMRQDEGYDMTNTVYLYPKDFERAHEEMVEITTRRKAEQRILACDKEFQKIAKNYKKLSKRYAWKNEGLEIRPAKSAGEIIMEGRALHHCVGSSDTYMRRHNEGKSYILLMRKEEDEATPYCTVEMTPDGTIKQWYQAYDKKTDMDIIQPWLDAYIDRIKQKAAV